MGHLFILDRDTGQPVLRIEERPVPQGRMPGKWFSPTQPFPVATPQLVRDRLEPEEAWGLIHGIVANAATRLRLAPRGYLHAAQPGRRSSILAISGERMGGGCLDRWRGLIVVDRSNLPFIAQLVPARG